MTTKNKNRGVFNYKIFRVLIGILAFSIPIVVCSLSSTDLTSISASYYTEARDVFIGLLFIVGVFLGVYNGYSIWESLASKIAALAIILVALIPTSCDICDTDLETRVHYISAGVFFLVLMYFCFGPFYKRAKSKEGGKTRSKIYLVCGALIFLCILAMAFNEAIKKWCGINIIYGAETIALWAFGSAWIVAGAYGSKSDEKSETTTKEAQ